MDKKQGHSEIDHEISEEVQCIICFDNVKSGEGLILSQCDHQFCK